MKTRTKKGKIWLSAALSLAMVGTAVGGFVTLGETLEAKADGEATVGAFVSYDGYKFNGTSDDATENRTVIKCVVSGWLRSLVYVENVTGDSQVELGLTPDKAVTLQLTVFDNPAVTTQYGTPVNQELPANTLFEKSFKLSDLTAFDSTATSCVLAFYIDTALATPSGARITVNTLTVDGVSYTKEAYDPDKDVSVTAPDKSFKEYEDWANTTTVGSSTTTACTLGASTLEAMPDTDERYETAINNGAATISIPANATAVTTDDATYATIHAAVEIPISEELTNGWPTDWTNFYLKLKVENIQEVYGYFQSVNNCDECQTTAQWTGWHAFAYSLWSGGAPSVSDGFRMASVGLGTYVENYTTTHTNMISKIVLAFVVKDATQAASVEIGGMTFGKEAPVFINDVGAPELALGDWNDVSNGNYTITKDGTVADADENEYTGLKIEYTKTAQYDNIYAAVANFDAAKTPNLHIGFYTDSEITFAIYNNWTGLQGHTTYTAGYHNVELDVSAVDSFENLRFYFDSANALEEGDKKTIVIDSIVFYENLEIALDDAITGAIYTDVETTETGISWKYDAASAGGFHNVAVPVNHWYSFVNRYIILDVSFSHDLKFGVGFTDSQWGNADLLQHIEYKKGDYKLCLDAANAANDNVLNKLWFWCDVNNGSEVALEKTVNIKSIKFSDVPALSSPNATVVEIDYAGRTISFDTTKYQVATTEEFTEGTLLESGAAVTPGTTIYLREFRGDELSPITEIELTATELTQENAPTPDVTENMIRYTVTGYEYKMDGKDNAWKALGSWGNLTAGTEYTIQIRKVATEDAFASEVLTVKVTTKTASSSGNDNNPGNSGNEGNSNNNEGGKGGNGLAIGLGVGGAVLVCVAAGLTVFFLKKRKK